MTRDKEYSKAIDIIDYLDEDQAIILLYVIAKKNPGVIVESEEEAIDNYTLNLYSTN